VIGALAPSAAEARPQRPRAHRYPRPRRPGERNRCQDRPADEGLDAHDLPLRNEAKAECPSDNVSDHIPSVNSNRPTRGYPRSCGRTGLAGLLRSAASRGTGGDFITRLCARPYASIFPRLGAAASCSGRSAADSAPGRASWSRSSRSCARAARPHGADQPLGQGKCERPQFRARACPLAARSGRSKASPT
jgi:hypothetical protein